MTAKIKNIGGQLKNYAKNKKTKSIKFKIKEYNCIVW